MPRSLECDGCGLAAIDLPDGVDPELVFEGSDVESRPAGERRR